MIKTPANFVPSKEEAQIALEVLKEFGKTGMKPDAIVHDGKLIAAAIAKLSNYDTDLAFETAAALIEEVNHHDLAKTIREA